MVRPGIPTPEQSWFHKAAAITAFYIFLTYSKRKMESWTEEQGIKFIGKPFETFGDVLDDNALQIIFRISGGTELLDHLC